MIVSENTLVCEQEGCHRLFHHDGPVLHNLDLYALAEKQGWRISAVYGSFCKEHARWEIAR